MLQALTPAMDHWRKRLSKIATNFEQANKAEIAKAEKRLETLTAQGEVRQGRGLQHFCPPQAAAIVVDLSSSRLLWHLVTWPQAGPVSSGACTTSFPVSLTL